MVIRPFQLADEMAVVGLWRACGLVRPQNDPRKDIRRKLKVNPEWFLVGEHQGRIVGSIMVGYEGHRGWANYLAIEPGLQRTGLGRLLMNEAEQLLREVGCPKLNLQVRSGNEAAVGFYRELGFSIDDVVSLGKRLEVD